MGLRDRWIEAINRAATASKPVRTLLTPVGALFFFGFIAALVLLSHWLDGRLAIPAFLPSSCNKIASAPLLVGGLFLVLWCIVRFLRAQGTPVPFNPPQELVAAGPYAVTRNPMLTGVFSTLFGIGLLMNSVCMTFVFTPLFVLLNMLKLPRFLVFRQFGQSHILADPVRFVDGDVVDIDRITGSGDGIEVEEISVVLVTPIDVVHT
jgi:protein-S-isoprenylcysteine O-methyltransferase Ste14